VHRARERFRVWWRPSAGTPRSASLPQGLRDAIHAFGSAAFGQERGDDDVDRLDTQTLHGLLQTYETALAELAAMSDPGTERLIQRVTRRRAEVVATLASR
jgi:hypothetical protein